MTTAVSGRYPRFLFLLAGAVLTMLLVAALPSNAAAVLYGSESAYQAAQLRVDPNVAVIPAWLEQDASTVTRQQFLDNLWRWQANGEGWTRDHINYGMLDTIVVGVDDRRCVAYRTDPETGGDSTHYDWQTDPLGGFLAPGVVLHALKVDDQHFILSCCGNHTQTAGTPEMPTISGYKFEDYNANGRWDAGEPPLANWTITLRRQGTVVAQTTTGSDGKYVFSFSAIRQGNATVNLDPGTYTVTESCPSPWRTTVAPGPIAIPDGPGIEHGGNTFGNVYPSSISGHKFDDTNQNGTWDAGEPTIANWPIQLSVGGVQTASTLTDANGAYSFANLLPGTYELSENLPAPWKPTLAPAPVVVLAEHGHDYSDNDFGNYYPGVIKGAKWDDSNVDGVWQKATEVALSGWTIALVEDGQVVATTTTEADGSYEFSGLDYGTYEVWEQLEATSPWRQTRPLPDGSLTPPLATAATGRYAALAVQSHTVHENKDFGNVETGSITKSVKHYWWREPIAGVEVTVTEVSVPGVLSNEPVLPRTATTGADGSISFDRLLPGAYRVSITIPEGWCAEPPASDEEIVTLPERGAERPCNTIYDGDRAEPRTLGYWKNWRLKYTDAQMLALIERVTTGSQSFPGLDISTLDSYLDVSAKKSSAFQMARAQYLTLWLNLASEKLGFTTQVNISTVRNWKSVVTDADGILTLNNLMLQLRARYTSGTLTERQWEALKDICDAINNFEVFMQPPTGPID